MRRETPEDLEYVPRHGHLTAAYAIQDFYDLLVELVTNSDDSYHRLFSDGEIPDDGGPILVEIERHKSKQSAISVSDRAEGFSDLRTKVKRVGEKTAKRGDRGFMARGLKDCAALGYVTIETICDGRVEKAEITPSFKFIPYRAAKASKEDRKRLGLLRGNGTKVGVKLEPRVRIPQLPTLAREISWHYALRSITRSGGPSRILLRAPGGKPQPVNYIPPEAELAHDEEFGIPGYPFRARLTVWRAQEPLEDPADKRFRRTGILIQGRRAIFACTFMMSELERDPAADRYFGWLSCDGIDELAEEWDERRADGAAHPANNPLLVLDPNRRTGLAENHPFTVALFQKPIEVLKELFEKEREEAKRAKQEVETKETTRRLQRLAREASRFMREKLEDLGAVGPGDAVTSKSYIKKGVGLAPSFTQIRVGEEKVFYVRVSPELQLPIGTVVEPFLSKAASSCLELIGAAADLELDPAVEGGLRGSFKVRGEAEARRVQLGCRVDALDPVFAEVQVVHGEPREIDIPNDFAFQRRSYTVREGRQRNLVLRARFDPPPAEPPGVKVRLTNPSVAKVRSPLKFELVPGATHYEATCRIEGKKLNGRTLVVAESDGHKAECELRVASRDEDVVDLEFKLVPYKLGENYRATWDRKHPNRLLITTQHESISRYLGREDLGYPGQHEPAFRVLLAELISDNVCRRIVEERARALPEEFDSDKIYVLHNRLMKEFTPVAHKVQLADPTPPA